MSYVWGTKPSWKTQELISVDTPLEKGEYALIEGYIIQTEWRIDPSFLPSAYDVVMKLKQATTENEGILHWAEVSSETEIYGDHHRKTFTINAIIEGDLAITAKILLVLILLLAIIALVVTAPVVWQLFGIELPPPPPPEIWWVIMLVVVIIAVAYGWRTFKG